MKYEFCLSIFICRLNGNLDKLSRIYPLYNGAWNDRTDCSEIPSVDLGAWREYPTQRPRPTTSNDKLYSTDPFPTYTIPYTVYAVIRNLAGR